MPYEVTEILGRMSRATCIRETMLYNMNCCQISMSKKSLTGVSNLNIWKK